nr:hypothetical protein [Tanacetum cinerariifolium]
MSSDNAYTSISSDLDGPSRGIPLMDVGELPEMDPYKEVTQQGHASRPSPAYVPALMELDKHVPLYVLEPEHPKYHVPSDDDMQIEDQPYADDALPTAKSPGYIADSESMEEDSIDYLHEPEDDKEDPEEDPSEEHVPEDNNEDPSDEHEHEDEDTKDEEPSEGSNETESFKEDETAALIDAFTARSPPFLLPPTSPAYDQAPLGHRTAMIRIRDDIPEENMPPQRRFVLTAPLPGCDVVESFAAARPPRV